MALVLRVRGGRGARDRGPTAFGRTNAATGATVSILGPIPPLSPWGYYKFNNGITVATGVSQWLDQSGNGRHLTQGTGANQPALQGDGSILFDGTNDALTTGNLASPAQPATFYIAFKQITWTLNDIVMTGFTSSGMKVYQTDTTPELKFTAGTDIPAGGDATIALNTGAVVCVVGNGASSRFAACAGGNRVITDADAGATNPNGFVIGALGAAGSNAANIQVWEAAVFASAHTDATQLSVMQWLAGVIGITPPVS